MLGSLTARLGEGNLFWMDGTGSGCRNDDVAVTVSVPQKAADLLRRPSPQHRANSDLMQCSKTGYFITSLAATISVGGTVRSSACVVLRLMNELDLGPLTTGRSEGLAPSELSRHRPRLVSYPGTQPTFGQMTRRVLPNRHLAFRERAFPPMGKSGCGGTHQ